MAWEDEPLFGVKKKSPRHFLGCPFRVEIELKQEKGGSDPLLKCR